MTKREAKYIKDQLLRRRLNRLTCETIAGFSAKVYRDLWTYGAAATKVEMIDGEIHVSVVPIDEVPGYEGSLKGFRWPVAD